LGEHGLSEGQDEGNEGKEEEKGRLPKSEKCHDRLPEKKLKGGPPARERTWNQFPPVGRRRQEAGIGRDATKTFSE
jgi:hypothetical protein